MASPSEIIIIHPDPKVRSTLGFLLEDMGFRIRLLERIPPRSSTPPTLAILELPAGGSPQLAIDFRHTYPEPRLLVLVREPTVAQLLALFPLSVDRCFPEPIKVEMILAAIRELIPDPEAAAEEEPPPPAPAPAATAPPMPAGPSSLPSVRPLTRAQGGHTNAPQGEGPPMRLFGVPEEDRTLDPVERKIADFRGFRGPLVLLGNDKAGAERAARKLAKMATNRDPVTIEPVGLSTVRKAVAEGRNEAIWVVRSPEVIPPPDREWLGQLVGQRDTTTPRILLPLGGTPPEWVRALNIASVRLPAEKAEG